MCFGRSGTRPHYRDPWIRSAPSVPVAARLVATSVRGAATTAHMCEGLGIDVSSVLFRRLGLVRDLLHKEKIHNQLYRYLHPCTRTPQAIRIFQLTTTNLKKPYLHVATLTLATADQTLHLPCHYHCLEPSIAFRIISTTLSFRQREPRLLPVATTELTIIASTIPTHQLNHLT